MHKYGKNAYLCPVYRRKMSCLSHIWKRAKHLVLNKYVLVLVGFGVFITFFDQHNLISRWRTGQHIKQLKQEISHYENEIENNKRKMQELQSSDENLEKFAREQYLMKKKDEDIFIMGE